MTNKVQKHEKITVPMDVKEFIERAGDRCPMCRSQEIGRVKQPQTDSDITWISWECKKCGSAWDEIYKLTDYEVTGWPTNCVHCGGSIREALEVA